MAQSKIIAYGMEIEGEWDDSIRTYLQDNYGFNWKGDGSVYSCRYIGISERKCDGLYRWEGINDIPLEFNEDNLVKTREMFDWLQNHYEDGSMYHWNKTCGLHFHFSFKPKYPMELMSLKFINYFREEMKSKLSDAYDKRKDNDRYCNFSLDLGQIANRSFGDRYRFINIRPALRDHGTIELRAFPADEPVKMKSYFDFSIDTIQTFIEKSNNDGILNESFSVELNDLDIPDRVIERTVDLRGSEDVEDIKNIVDIVDLEEVRERWIPSIESMPF